MPPPHQVSCTDVEPVLWSRTIRLLYGPRTRGGRGGEPHGEATVDGRRDLCEGPEGGASVLHQEDRAEGAISDVQVGLSGPRRDEGWRRRGPYTVAAGPGVGPRDLRGA